MPSNALVFAAALAISIAHLPSAHAQDMLPTRDGNSHEALQQRSTVVNPALPLIEPIYAWQRPSWRETNTLINGPLYDAGMWAGDINGDGRVDLIYVEYVLDDRDPSDHSFTWKTFVYYGGVVSATPDQVVYARLEPVGDLDGDGYADATDYGYGRARVWRGTPDGYVLSGVELEAPHYQSDSGPSTGVDLDGDGHLDFLWRSRTGGDRSFQILYGADAMEDVRVKSFWWPEQFMMGAITMGVGGDGRPFLAAVGRTTTDPAVSIRLFTVDAQHQIVDLQSLSLHGHEVPSLGAVQLYLIDLNGDGQLELVLERITVRQVLETDLPLLAFRRDVESESIHYHNEVLVLSNNHLRPIGDLNGNGRHDFLRVDVATRTAHIVFGPESLGEPLVEGPRIGAAGQRIYLPQTTPAGLFGDITGNGFHDVVVEFDERRPIGEGGAFGQIVLEGGSLKQDERRFADTDYYGPEISFTTNLGDIDGDGIDDLALTAVWGLWPAVHFHWSGAGLRQEPDRVLSKAEWRPTAVAAGDFTGNGHVDIAILWSDRWHDRATFVEVYIDADFDLQPHVITTEDVGGEPVRNLTNVGDLNGDGIDDLLLNGWRTAYLYFGGNIRRTPDLKWPLPQTAYSVTAIGDVNADGIDDLAISLGLRVFVYFGREGLTHSDVNAPDVELRRLTSDSSSRFGEFGLTAGDFNGDGHNDIAVLATIGNFTLPADQPPPLQVFFGGPDFDGVPDLLAYLPEDPSSGLFQSLFQCSELVTLPGGGGDRDGILVGSCRANNAYVYMAGETTLSIRAILEAPGAGGIGTNSLPVLPPYTSAAGDFTGDGVINVALPRRIDMARPGSSTFLFKIEPMQEALPVLAQFVHASADPALQTVTLSIHGVNIANGLRFREATSTLTMPGIAPFKISLTAEGRNEPVELYVPALYAGEYWLVLTGVSQPTHFFATNPNGTAIHLGIEVVSRTTQRGAVVHFVQGVTDIDLLTAGRVSSDSMPVLLFEGRYGGTVESRDFAALPGPVELYLNPDPVQNRAYRLDLLEPEDEILLVSTGFKTPSWNRNGPAMDLIFVRYGSPAANVETFVVSSEEADDLPRVVALHPAYPNPFNPSTTFTVDLPSNAHVSLHIFDILGRRVTTLIDDSVQAGRHTVTFEADGLASGAYFVILKAGDVRKTQKIVLLK